MSSQDLDALAVIGVNLRVFRTFRLTTMALLDPPPLPAPKAGPAV